MGDEADACLENQMAEALFDMEEQIDYETEVEYWFKQPLEEIIATVRPYIDKPGVHEIITGAVEDYVVFGTVGDFQKKALARFITRL